MSFAWVSGKPVSMTNQQGTTFYYVTNYRGDVIRIIDTAGKRWRVTNTILGGML